MRNLKTEMTSGAWGEGKWALPQIAGDCKDQTSVLKSPRGLSHFLIQRLYFPTCTQDSCHLATVTALSETNKCWSGRRSNNEV